MPTLTDNIVTWEDDRNAFEPSFGQDAIATETHQDESPVWSQCIDALLKVWPGPSSLGNCVEKLPNRTAIENAITWIVFLKRLFPNYPPTCITPDPDGGIIVERRSQLPGGQEALCELTFLNDDTAERTDYLNGRVRQMTAIPPRPGLG